MKGKLLFVIVIIASIFLTGFTSSDQVVIDNIKGRVDKLESDYTFLSKLQSQDSMDITELNTYKNVYFNATDIQKTYARLDTNGGMFFVILEDAVKVNSNYMLTFNIGNPQYCTYNGFKVTIDYNKSIGKQLFSEWNKTLKSMDFEFTSQLLPGSWKNIFISVPAGNISDLGYIKLNMMIDSITLDNQQIKTPPIINQDTTQQSDLIESKIDGDFEGVGYENIYKLINGQIWQQTSSDYHYHYAYSPEVIIYKSGTVYKMIIEGVDKKITVKRIK